jgi:hypothetical protein
MATNVDQHVGGSGSFFHLPNDSLDLIAALMRIASAS